MNSLDLVALSQAQPELVGRGLELFRNRLLEQFDFGPSLPRLLSPPHRCKASHRHHESPRDRDPTT
jgi:hypothetical protein